MSLGSFQGDVFGPVVFCRKKRWNLWSRAPGAYNTGGLTGGARCVSFGRHDDSPGKSAPFWTWKNMKRKILTGMVLAIAIVGIVTFFFLRDSGSGDYVSGGVAQQGSGGEFAVETAEPGADEKPGSETAEKTGEEETAG